MENKTRDYPSARPSGPLNGKVAIVTGAPRSIGRAIAQALTADGASVVVHYRSRRDEAEDTVASLRSRGAHALAVRADLTESSEVSALFAATTAHFGGVDIVVANAGVTAPLTPLADVTTEEFDRLLAVNTRSVFFVLREAARTIRDGGRIINITSSTVKFTPAGFSAYATTKAGANVTVGVLANELGNRGITVNSIMVGPVAAGFLAVDSEVVAGAPTGMMESLAAAAPMRRLGHPSDIAGIAAFLATPAAGWVNGQILLANNGGSI